MSEFITQTIERHRSKLNFLLPSALLGGSYALQGYPLAATTTTTALGALGLLDHMDNPRAMGGSLGLALLLATAPLSIYRAWQAVGVDRFANLANGAMGAGLASLALYSTYRRGFDPTYPAHTRPIIYGLLPALFFGLYQTGLLPSHLAAVGLGALVWGASLSASSQGSAPDLALGTSLAAIPFALFGIVQSGDWGNRLLFAQTALLYAAPLLFIFSPELKKSTSLSSSRLNFLWQCVEEKFALRDKGEAYHALGRFLLPSLILLEGVAFQSYPIAGMVATTGLAAIAALSNPRPDNLAVPVAMSAIFSVAGMALYRSWSNWSDKGLVLFGNASLALATSLIGGFYAYLGCKFAYEMHKEGKFQDQRTKTETLSHLLGLFLPTLCFAIHKIAPPAYAAVGLGATTWGTLLLSKKQSDEGDELRIEPFALGVALAALPLSIAGLFQSSSWSSRLLFGSGALLQASSFAPLAIEIQKRNK